VKYSEQDYHNVEAGGIKFLYVDYVNLLQENKSTLTPKTVLSPTVVIPLAF
jgi:hypothetical protein